MKENYSWIDMANFMTKCGIPHLVVAKLADPVISMIVYKRPVFNLLTFDDYLHERYGDYESEENLRQIFSRNYLAIKLNKQNIILE